ncbi:GNAT family N-acetyltransferase [Streptomyces venezuelae]|uniref:GNAT family N-acetyltransferase n=1 Tax=Streptomyces venezuelae TaxID=54571 RepID=A0A5P2D7I2_STRVZ|nr:GNAT family N-acetyltransferase [Streptomyces venezuelae]QES51006.1 GNAT family N-acetyltransferase [Streptomyces venezuelae]
MTTTLRPSEPLQQHSDGSRSRAYEVRVNSRRVGALELAAGQDAVGVIRGLWIDEPDRGRGRGTVAALAAEEVLRSWRCAHITVSVPADAGPALRLATALGYRETGRIMAKELPAVPPELPAESAGRPMTGAEYEVWEETGVRAYAEQLALPGTTAEQALAASRAEHDRLLPAGRDTPGATLLVLETPGAGVVGSVWVGDRELPGTGTVGYVYDVEVAEGQRGRGHGRSLMLLAERAALTAGAATLALHVAADNTTARNLYESLGYRDVTVNAMKELL